MNKKIENLLYDLKEMAQYQMPLSLSSLENTILRYNHYCLHETVGPNKRLNILNSNYAVIATLTIDMINNDEILINCCRWVKGIPDLNYQINNGKLSYLTCL